MSSNLFTYYFIYFFEDTWRKDVRASDIGDAINQVVPEKLVVLEVSKVLLHLISLSPFYVTLQLGNSFHAVMSFW